MIQEELKERKLPEVLTLNNGRVADSPVLWRERREEILRILKSEVYGFSPAPPRNVSAITEKCNNNAFAGKAVHSALRIQFDTPKGKFSFPVNLIIPKNVSPAPLFLHIAFRPGIPDIYCPSEEIIDGGFAVASFCYEDITPDTNDGFTQGLPAMYTGGSRKPDDWGKISMWAWAASRVMDYLETLDTIDKKRISVIGHSRLGKTSLWCAAQDERFAFGISNDSGCSGAAVNRGKVGEQIKNITDNFGYWFCENYRKYSGNEMNMPFDQHFLLAAIAPRHIYVSSALEDEWSDPKSEFIGCAAVQCVYELFGLKGLVTTDAFPKPGTVLHEGEIGYHLRQGTHFLSRYDWQRFMEYVRSK